MGSHFLFQCYLQFFFLVCHVFLFFSFKFFLSSFFLWYLSIFYLYHIAPMGLIFHSVLSKRLVRCAILLTVYTVYVCIAITGRLDLSTRTVKCVKSPYCTYIFSVNNHIATCTIATVNCSLKIWPNAMKISTSWLRCNIFYVYCTFFFFQYCHPQCHWTGLTGVSSVGGSKTVSQVSRVTTARWAKVSVGISISY